MFKELTARQILLGNNCAVGVQWIDTINKAYGGLVKTLTDVTPWRRWRWCTTDRYRLVSSVDAQSNRLLGYFFSETKQTRK